MQINISKTEFLVTNSDDKYEINIMEEQILNQDYLRFIPVDRFNMDNHCQSRWKRDVNPDG